jgi:hypothetical protein
VAVEGRWWGEWMDIFDDVRQVSVSKAVCSYHGVYSFVFAQFVHTRFYLGCMNQPLIFGCLKQPTEVAHHNNGCR